MRDDKDIQSVAGSFLVAGSAVSYSTAGYFTRLIELDVPTLLVWRGLFAGVFMILCIATMHGGRTLATFREMGLAGILVAVLSALATVCYLYALRLTSVAEVLAIGATSPFVSGTLAWLAIGERERLATIVASAFALVGILVMVGPGALSGHAGGAVLAFAMTFCLSSMIVMMRAKKAVSMLPASCLSAFLSALVVLPFGAVSIPNGGAMLNLAMFGIVQFGFGLILLTMGARRVTALRTSLLGRLQTVLGPFWVWLAFDEIPPLTTLVGGSIVLASTVVATLIANRRTGGRD